MRCHICNAVLSPAEISANKDHQDFDPCTTCQDVIDSVFNDDTEEEIDEALAFELMSEPSDEEDEEDADEYAAGFSTKSS